MGARLVVVGWIATLALWMVACNGEPDTGSETHWGNEPQLPELGPPGNGDCELEPEELLLDLREWIGLADGLIIGDVVSVEPALEVGWAPVVPEGQSQIVEGDQCERIQNAFAVELENISGYLHDQELPDEMTVYFGWSFMLALPPEVSPWTDEEGVDWPDEEVGIFEGMRIGGLIFHEPVITDRWSFRIAPDMDRRLFLVDDDQITHQEAQYSYCSYSGPVDQIEALGESGLLAELAALDAEGSLYVAPEDRLWSVHGHAIYDEDPPRLPAPSHWVAECQLPDEAFPDDYCFDDSDCDGGDICVAGDCVGCMSDADCGPGEICGEVGQCISED